MKPTTINTHIDCSNNSKCSVRHSLGNQTRSLWKCLLHHFLLIYSSLVSKILAGTRNCLLLLITNTPIHVHCPKHWHQWNKAWVNEKTVEGCCNWIISPHVRGLDDVEDIYKLVSYFVCQTSGWKDSFFKLTISFMKLWGMMVHVGNGMFA